MPIRLLIYTLAGTIIIGAVSSFSNSNAGVYDKQYSMHIGDQDISLIVVNTNETRTMGLSGMESLPEDQAMLFVFNEPDKYGIWMKDMKFPIDIIWLDDQKKVVYIESDISPDTYPKVFTPEQESLYILETNTGFIEKNNIEVGKVLNFTLN